MWIVFLKWGLCKLVFLLIDVVKVFIDIVKVSINVVDRFIEIVLVGWFYIYVIYF